MSRRALAADELANLWAGKVTRKVVKVPLMASGYGITDIGIREALMPAAAEISPRQAFVLARWLAYRLKEITENTMPGPDAINATLQETARMITGAGRPISWTTPSGSRVVQAYVNPHPVRVETLGGKLQWHEPGDVKADAAVGASVRALPANWVHSLDAAHLVAVVNAFGRDISTVHDCFGAHASDVGDMREILREEFHGLHRVERLAEFQQQQRDQHPDLLIPDAPALGLLDIGGVLQSDYLFS